MRDQILGVIIVEMFENTDAVTTSCYHPHNSNLVDSTDFNPTKSTILVHSQSVDQPYYDSNKCAPVMITRTCGQQHQRLTKHASFEQPGLSPHGQPLHPSRYSNFGNSSRVQHSHVSSSYCNADSVVTFGDLLDKRNCSVFSLQNERYKLDASSLREHENEDEFLIYSNNKSLCMCVFDGHDGSRAAKFAHKYIKGNIFDTKSWKNLLDFNDHREIESALAEFIKVTDKDFFKNIKIYIDEKLYIQSQMPRGMKSYQAQQSFPGLVARLQELESCISGGCTAVVAVLTSSRLYVANVGDSRAILAYEASNGSLQVKQLSDDHGVENEQELERLTALGLDREQLKESGRLGPQENTRSIGDYSIKAGYKDVDVLSHATDQPGTAIPYVISIPIDRFSYKYLILMSDGVYKTIEAIAGEAVTEDNNGNHIVVTMIEQYISKNGWDHDLAKHIVKKIRQIQYDLYQRLAREDDRSTAAVANRKRDDMTLVIYKFDTLSTKFYTSTQVDS